MKKAITAIVFMCAVILGAAITGDYNTWFGHLSGEDASGNRATAFGAGAGGGAQDLYRTDLIGAAAGVDGRQIIDTVGIGYRALRGSIGVSNSVAIGTFALAGVGGMGEIHDATWVNGHFVANPPRFDAANNVWSQTQGEFYITGDSSKTNSLAPIWYDGTNLHLRGYSPGGVTNAITYVDLIGLSSMAILQPPWFRNEVTFCPQKVQVAFYASDDSSEGEYLGDSDKVPMVYLRKNATSGAVEVWEGTTKLGTLTLDP